MSLVSPNGTGEGVGASSGAGTVITVTKPSGAASGHVAVVVLAVKGGSNVAFVAGTGIPAGWSQAGTPRVNQGTSIAYIPFWKVLGGSEPSSYVWTMTGGNKQFAYQIRLYSGRNTVNPIGAASGQGNSTNANSTAPTVTVPSDGSDLIYISVINRGLVSSLAHTDPGGFSNPEETNSNTATTGVSISTSDRAQGDGATGTVVGVWSTADLNIGALIALSPSTATFSRYATPITLSVVTGYAALVYATSGIQSYWRLGETAGTTAEDAVGSVDGTYVGSPALNQTSLLPSDTADGSVAFDGADDAITFASSAYNFVGTAAFSVEFMVRLGTDDLGYPLYLITKEDGPVGGTGWSIIQIDNDIGLEIYNGGTPLGSAWVSGLTANVPNHIVFTVSSSQIKAYVNGSLRDTQSRGTMPAVTANLRIGEMSSGGNQFLGRLDEIAIYNVALSGATVQAHADATGIMVGTITATPVSASIGINVVDHDVHTAPTGHGPFELVDGERVVYIINVYALTPSVRGDTVAIEVYATDAEAIDVERVNLVVMEEPGQIIFSMEGIAGSNRPMRYLSIIPDADTEMEGALLILNGSDQLTD